VGNNPHSRLVSEPRCRQNVENLRESGGTAGGTSVAPAVGMITKERVESVLERVRPFMRADGGDIELLDVDGNSADVRLTGMCAGCPSAHMTLYLGVETALREEMPEFETLRLR
jgi:Fe-S cluster biogenesis protein NfuA